MIHLFESLQGSSYMVVLKWSLAADDAKHNIVLDSSWS